MKTIKELEKEIEKMDNRKLTLDEHLDYGELKTKLKTLKEVLEIIEGMQFADNLIHAEAWEFASKLKQRITEGSKDE